MSLLSRFNQPDSGKIHSSGIAAANDGSAQALGAMRHESFEQRLAREHNRQHIGGYQSAAVVQRGMVVPARGSVSAANGAPSRGVIDVVRPNRQQRNAQVIALPSVNKANFAEPTSRGFNPYR